MGKKRQSEEFNLKYFTIVVGLSLEGLSPRHMNPKYVSLVECEKVRGRRCSNSHGFKYKKSCTDEDVIVMVEELWPKVYQRSIITNGDIGLSFAKGLLPQKKQYQVNWASFATQVQCQGVNAHNVGHNSGSLRRPQVLKGRREKSL
jgi:hypothetical protein